MGEFTGVDVSLASITCECVSRGLRGQMVIVHMHRLGVESFCFLLVLPLKMQSLRMRHGLGASEFYNEE